MIPSRRYPQPSSSADAMTTAACTEAVLLPNDDAHCFLTVEGPQAAEFLDGVVSQSATAQPSGSLLQALLLDRKAHIIAALRCYRLQNDQFVLELPAAQLDAAVAHLRKYRLRSKCTIEPANYATLTCVGPASHSIVAHAIDPSEAPVHWFDEGQYGPPDTVALGTSTAIEHLHLVLSAHSLLEAQPATLHALRIANGLPSIDDYLVGRMPAEVGAIPHAVSLDKGCYLGQEPVARLHYRGKANRTLRQVRMSDSVDGVGVEIFARAQPNERPVGQLASCAYSAQHGVIGFACIRREIADGDELMCRSSTGTQILLAPTTLEPPCANFMKPLQTSE